MSSEPLRILNHPGLAAPRLILGFSGWMDGGDVSTGVVDYLVDHLDAEKLAEIDPCPFYIYNFPGSMEVAALIRPHVKIEDGLITEYDNPAATFYFDESNQLILFNGKEPNLRWPEFAGCILSVAEQFHVSAIYFVGSVAGLAPHTRDARIFSSVSDADLLAVAKQHNLVPSSYEGPGSFITYLTTQAKDRGIPMMALVAEIPPYVSARNDKCIAAMVAKLAAILPIEEEFPDLETSSREFESRLNLALQEHPDLLKQIRELEKSFDEQVSGDKDEELKAWLEKQGFRLD